MTLEYDTFDLGDWELQSGQVLKNTHIAYKTFGIPTSPAIVYPTWFSGSLSDNFWLIGEDKTLDPRKVELASSSVFPYYFIIVPALFGNGQSSSPSNHTANPFPQIAFYDNVRAQYRLVEHLGIRRLFAVVGWSMGAGQTFQWITQYPDFVDLAVPFCGSARTSLHNQVFLEGVKSALLAAKKIQSAGSKKGGVAVEGTEARTWTDEEKSVGLKAFGRGYAGWGFSQAFYREKFHEKHFGSKDLEDFIVNFWEKWACSKDPENLLTMLQTWQSGDCSLQSPYNGDFEASMRGIKAKTLVLPSKTDLYFP
ncbi:MAG: hypothetical protein Q9195_007220 [Heterodermia aff. obscurata]